VAARRAPAPTTAAAAASSASRVAATRVSLGCAKPLGTASARASADLSNYAGGAGQDFDDGAALVPDDDVRRLSGADPASRDSSADRLPAPAPAEDRLAALQAVMKLNQPSAEPQPVHFDAVQSSGGDEKARFETELEFVQSLANPNYLNCECAQSMVYL